MVHFCRMAMLITDILFSADFQDNGFLLFTTMNSDFISLSYKCVLLICLYLS